MTTMTCPDQRSACITGAASGIGQAVALRLAKEGLRRLLLVDLDAEGLAGTADQLAATGAEAHKLCLDVADHAETSRSLTLAATGLGRLDVLVHCAGVATPNRLDEDDTWFRVIAVNLHGAFSVTRALVPFMKHGGRIVHVGSILGLAGARNNTAYVTSKHGLTGFSKALALDLAAQGITVNVVLPAWVDTPMLQQEMSRQARQAGQPLATITAKAKKSIPIKRLVQAEEVAHTVAFLCSEQAGGITAQRFVIDGGVLCGA